MAGITKSGFLQIFMNRMNFWCNKLLPFHHQAGLYEGCPKKTNIVSILLNLLHSYTIPSYVYRSNINIFKSLCLTDGTSSIAVQRASSVGIVNKHFVVIGNNWSPLLVLDQSSLANFPRHKVCTPPNTFQHPDM